MKRRTATKQKAGFAALLIAAILVVVGVVSWTLLSPDADTNTNTPQQKVSEGTVVGGGSAEPQMRIAPELPIQLLDFASGSEYHHAESLESWKIIREESCADYALKVLESIQSQGLGLVQAGFMDLHGECWGCVFIGSSGESMQITLMPKRPFSPRSEANPLVVNVLHYFEQEKFA